MVDWDRPGPRHTENKVDMATTRRSTHKNSFDYSVYRFWLIKYVFIRKRERYKSDLRLTSLQQKNAFGHIVDDPANAFQQAIASGCTAWLDRLTKTTPMHHGDDGTLDFDIHI